MRLTSRASKAESISFGPACLGSGTTGLSLDPNAAIAAKTRELLLPFEDPLFSPIGTSCMRELRRELFPVLMLRVKELMDDLGGLGFLVGPNMSLIIKEFEEK